MLKNIFSLAFCICFAACGHQHKHDAVLEQAGQIHLEAVQMDEKIKPALEKVFTVKKQLQQKQTDLSPEENRILQEITQLESSYVFWEENHVEVPGLDHAGHHNCSHNHGRTALEVSSEDMLLIQQEFKDSLSSIAARLEKLSIPDSLLIL